MSLFVARELGIIISNKRKVTETIRKTLEFFPLIRGLGSSTLENAVVVMNVSDLEQKFKEIEDKRGWAVEYQKLKNDASKQEVEQKLKCNDARAPQNIRSNRYRDVLPYDDSRVKLVEDDSSLNYINASLVPVPKAGRVYILTQGPLHETANDFWRMVWQEKTSLVIMLNKIVEKNTIKCYQYFPLRVGDSLHYENYDLECVKCTENDHFVVRQLLLRKSTESSESSEERDVFHYQFITWPDFGVPARTTDFLEFLLEVRKSGLLNYKKHGHPVVHCSAGIGRSGTFVIVDAVLVMAELDGSVSANIDIYKLVLELRCYRMGLIQTPDQLRFCWHAVLDALREEKWKDLLKSKCYDRGEEDRRPQLSRGVGNKLTLGNSAISVDNSDLVTRKRSQSARKSGDVAPVTDADADSDPIHPKSAKSAAEEGSSYNSRRAILKERNAKTREKLEEIKRKMRESEASQLRKYAAYGAAACVFVGFALYYCFWNV